MASEDFLNEAASDESSESELLDRSLSCWNGWSGLEEDFAPLPVDIHTASSLGQYGAVRTFIIRGDVDLNRKNLGGWTPLMYASYIGHDNVVNLLLESKVDVHTKNNKGRTALMLAASCGNESICCFLLCQGANIEAKDKKGWTALFHATYAGHQNVVKFLLENSADKEVSAVHEYARTSRGQLGDGSGRLMYHPLRCVAGHPLLSSRHPGAALLPPVRQNIVNCTEAVRKKKIRTRLFTPTKSISKFSLAHL